MPLNVDSLPGEKWLDIPGYENVYAVSSLGRVYSYKRYRLLKGIINDEGYPQVGLQKNGKNRRWRVHQLVLLAFVGPRPADMESRHFPDHDKTNNRLENLSYCTSSQNVQDNVSRGMYRTNALLTDDQVRLIRSVSLDYGETNSFCESLGISRTAFHCIRRGATYQHVKDK